MLDTTTKQQIDSLRDTLVGKIPNPQGQVQQITLGLIYKFMSDIDEQRSVLFDNSEGFFAEDYKQYRRSNLMDPKKSAQERLNLYSEGLEKMSNNPNLPDLFRSIFKQGFLPYRDPATLNLFLKQIDEFIYDDSEKLGDAFEYLLNALSSAGDAGQFRTPRHIIDFIVEVVQPGQDDKILDPACGTAGFLISAYKYLTKTYENLEMDKISEQIVGYDISPEMVQLSLVNLYLHHFPNPRVEEYDTLSSDTHRSERFDTILANPPFMTPKGGIIPHDKFAVSSSRAEVLFVDYIIEHLRHDGKAGIIVPEGVVSNNNDGAFVAIRKMLMEQGLRAVVSLPSGIFNPYAGVKTSILLIDKTINSDDFVFVKVNNDGFDLGKQRREISDNDLPHILDKLLTLKSQLKSGEKIGPDLEFLDNDPLFWIVAKEQIAEGEKYNLNGRIYQADKNIYEGDRPTAKLGDILDYEQPTNYIVNSTNYSDNYKTPVLTAGKSFILGYTDETNGIFPANKLPVIIFDDFTTATKFVDFPFKVKSSAMKILIPDREKANVSYVYHIMQNIDFDHETHKRYRISEYSQIEIPLPPLDIQEQIVAELEGYQQIIDGARQIVDNRKPSITIDPDWEMVELGKVCEVKSGGTPSRKEKNYWENGTIPRLRSEVCKDGIVEKATEYITEIGLTNSSAKYLESGTTLIALVGATIGQTAFLNFRATTNQNIAGLYPKDLQQLHKKYLRLVSQTLYDQFINLGDGGFKMANMSFVKGLKIPLPPLDIQEQIVAQIEHEQSLVDSASSLISLYEQKIKDRVQKVWEG